MTSTATRMTLATYSVATDARLSTIEAGIGALLAAQGLTTEAPARTRATRRAAAKRASTKAAPKARSAKATTKATKVTPAKAKVEKTLTRGAWKRIRVTKAGTVKKAFSGLTREQAFEKGLCPGYRLPTGELRASLKG